jgi:MFS family permease
MLEAHESEIEAVAEAAAARESETEWPVRRPSLWHHADYVKIWSAATVSLMGSQVSQIAIPFIAAVLLQASAFQVAMLGAVDMLPFLLLTLPAGAWLDRVRRRPVMVLGDFGRAVALLSIPLAYAANALTTWQLYLVGFVTGTLTVLFEVADQSYLPVLLEPQDLVEGNAKLQVSGSAATIVGPSLSGGLIAIIGRTAAPFAIIVDAASFFISGALISLVRKHEAEPGRRRTHLLGEIREGLAYVLGHRHLRMIAGSTATSNLGSSIAFSVFPVFAYVELGLNPGLIGAAFGLGGFGILAGAMLAAPMARSFGVGPVIIGSMFVSGIGTFGLVLLTGQPLFAGGLLLASQFVGGFCAVVYNVNQVSYRQAITPLEIQGRMNATMRFMVWGTLPIGSFIGGILATFLPLRTTILVGAIVSGVAFLWVLASPVRSLRVIPTQAHERAEGA